MGLICKTDCQIEVSPGMFKYIVQGQTHFDIDKKIPITLREVGPLARKYFQLSGEDIKRDIQDKSKIIKALKKRNIRVPNGARTTDVANLLARDNKSRGIVNPLSLEIVTAPSHIADKGVILAKERIDELFEITEPHHDRPYTDKTPLDALLKIIEGKEIELGGDTEDDEATEIAELKKWLDENGGTYHHQNGVKKLREAKATREKELASSDGE